MNYNSSDWSAPTCAHPLAAQIQIPGSKSETNRALFIAAIAKTPSQLHGCLHARDTTLMIDALRTLGATIVENQATGDVTVFPLTRVKGNTTIHCGLAGTVLRFLTPLAAFADGPVTFTGDETAKARPIQPLLDSLMSLGVQVTYLEKEGALPFIINGSLADADAFVPGHVRIDASASSQFLSALLLSAPLFSHEITIESDGAVISLPHIEMTISALEKAGARIRRSTQNKHAWTINSGRLKGGEITIAPDLSNAGPFLAAAMVCGGFIEIPNWPHATNQPGDAWRTLLPLMGGKVSHYDSILRIEGPGRAGIQGIDIDLSDYGELTPTIAALATLAQTLSSLRGIGHLRGHETDRLTALSTEISRIGGVVQESDTALDIFPTPLHGARIHTYADHRMATFAAIIGLAVPGITVENIETTSKTLPNFVSLWESMLNNSASIVSRPNSGSANGK